MTLPLTTRQVKIEAPVASTGDAFEAQTFTVVHDSVPAHIGPPSASNAGDRYEQTDRVLFVDDTVTVPFNARITDLTTGDIYSAQWSNSTVGLGLDHRKVGLRYSRGAG